MSFSLSSSASTNATDDAFAGLGLGYLAEDETMVAALSTSKLHEFLASLPAEMKVDYLDALTRSPILMKTESHPLKFLRREAFNPLAAALKLVLYWKVRRQIFGDRAFLSMLTLDGSGCLNEDDLTVLQTGFLCPLSAVESGRSVIFCDPSRVRGVPACSLIMSCLRCAFYISTAASESRTDVKNGLSVIVLLCLQDFAELFKVTEPVKQLLEALPVRVKKFIIVQGTGWMDEKLFVSSILSDAINLSDQLAAEFPVPVSGHSSPHIALKLQSLGFSVSSLPPSLGGSWSYNNFLASLLFKGMKVVGDTSGLANMHGGALLQSQRFSSGPLVRANNQDLGRAFRHGDLLPASSIALRDFAMPGHLNRVPACFADQAPAGLDVSTASVSFVGEPNRASIDTMKPHGITRLPANRAPSVSERGFATTGAPSVSDRGLEELYSAIGLLPAEKKMAFLEAQKLVPELVEKESPPKRFLRFANFDFWAAADRLASYWRIRKEIFGERWALPMNQTGEGTLTREDVNVLRSGFYTLLPSDVKGRPVICGHPSRRVDHSRLPRLRLAFYMWSILSENEMAQTEGCVIIAVLHKPTLDRVVRECSNLVQEALPIRVHRMHVVHPPKDFHKQTFLESLVPLCLKLFGRFIEKLATVHVADTLDELRDKLVLQGLNEEGIPEDIGGLWKYDSFNQWCELRMCYEWELPVVGARNADELPFIPQYNAKARSELNEDEKVERKRRLNVLHSRRKRERSRVEKEVLVGQVNELKSENARLAKENKRFEELLDRARDAISTEASKRKRR